jgi:hypothetical protein
MFFRLRVFEKKPHPAHRIAEEKFLVERGETIGG